MRTVAAVSAVHGRDDITRAWAIHCASLGFSHIIAAVTDDTTNDANARILEDYGIVVVRHANQPLSHKFQAALDACPQADVYMVLPSDDFVHPAWMERVRTWTEAYMLPAPMAMYDSTTGRAITIEHPAHVGGHLRYGACRAFTHAVRSIVTPLWDKAMERGLDSLSHMNILGAGFTPSVCVMDEVAFTDIKSKDSLWPYMAYDGSMRTIDPGIATGHITDPLARSLLGLPSRHTP